MALCFASKNNKIVAIDKNIEYINSINNSTFVSSEKNVNSMLDQYKDNIIFTTDISKSLESDIIFIVVPTPSLENDEYDHSIIDSIINELISLSSKNDKKRNIVISSTTMPGYCNKIYNQLKEYNYDLCYNPEFIAQGSIIRDMLSPDIMLIGESSELSKCGDLIIDIYSNLVNNKPKIHRMSLIEAEIVKISINCFITTKIAFANMIGDALIANGCKPDKALNAIGSDDRIGERNLKWGFGYGGPCFPRDNRALGKFLNNNGLYNNICKATDESNKLHLEEQIKQFEKMHPNKDEIIEIKDITYKKDTEILEESQQLKFAIKLLDNGYKVKIIDNEKIIHRVKNINNKFI
jgi:nucleotide sugar dehydrogenase